MPEPFTARACNLHLTVTEGYVEFLGTYPIDFNGSLRGVCQFLSG